ncbi:hypothetical protein CAEBREN_23574 [Caenorhabditis brenneri]|uniref:F-box domain-containing protein n=1 Tax=Caenorhabditis brenneri TaxID=135651 RepID=G0MIS2_CAEBE|nr:hypothetical protein CAEBREN_23574 [Caenorhabditis brenneri]
MNRFPLLRLPYVALREVILSTDRSDVINLALSSKNSCRIINTTKNAVSMRKMSQDVIDELGAVDRLKIGRLENLENSTNVIKTINLEVSKHSTYKISLLYFTGGPNVSLEQKKYLIFELQVRSIKDKTEGKRKIIRLGGTDVPVIIKSKCEICTLWEDIEFGAQFLSQHFLQLLKLNQSTLIVDPKGTDGSEFSGILKIALKSFSKEKSVLSIANIEFMRDSDLKTVVHNIGYGTIRIIGDRDGRVRNTFECEARQLVNMRMRGRF